MPNRTYSIIGHLVTGVFSCTLLSASSTFSAASLTCFTLAISKMAPGMFDPLIKSLFPLPLIILLNGREGRAAQFIISLLQQTLNSLNQPQENRTYTATLTPGINIALLGTLGYVFHSISHCAYHHTDALEELWIINPLCRRLVYGKLNKIDG